MYKYTTFKRSFITRRLFNDVDQLHFYCYFYVFTAHCTAYFVTVVMCDCHVVIIRYLLTSLTYLLRVYNHTMLPFILTQVQLLSHSWYLSAIALKPGFHYPSSRAELTARELGCIFWHPSTRAVNSGSGNRMPVYTGKVLHTFDDVENQSGIFIRVKVDHISDRTVGQCWTVHWDIVLTRHRHNSMVK